jgi:DNA-binding winged helix-turn-helix (wHTH) protein
LTFKVGYKLSGDGWLNGLSTGIRTFTLGSFEVYPDLDRLCCGSKNLKVEPLIMNVLMLLVFKHGQLITREEFMESIWPEVDVSDEVLTRAISVLRKLFRAEDPGTTYIETVARRGYCLANAIISTAHSPSPIVGAANNASSSKKDVDALYFQACALLKQPFIEGASRNAVAYLGEALLLDDTSADVHAALGEGYYQLVTHGDQKSKKDMLELAAKSAKRAIDLDPDLGLPLTIWAMERFLAGDIVGALDLAFRAFELSPDVSDVAMRLGYLLAIIGRTRQAIPYYELAVSLDPARGRNLQSLAQAKLCNDDFDEAEVLAEKAIALHHLFAYDTYAAVAYAQGHDALAAERFTQGCNSMYGMFGQKFGNPDVWEKFPGLVFSRDPVIRKTVADWLGAHEKDNDEPPSIPVMVVFMRTGAAEAIFEACGTSPPIGAHGALLRIWGGVDTCRMIYTHPGFPAFAARIGMKSAWEKYGKPDRLS